MLPAGGTGSLPQSWSTLPNLRVLDVSSNAIMGSLPPELGASGALPRLEQLLLSSNIIAGEQQPHTHH